LFRSNLNNNNNFKNISNLNNNGTFQNLNNNNSLLSKENQFQSPNNFQNLNVNNNFNIQNTPQNEEIIEKIDYKNIKKQVINFDYNQVIEFIFSHYGKIPGPTPQIFMKLARFIELL